VRRQKIFQGGGAMEKYQKLAKNTEKWYYLTSSRGGETEK